MASDEFGRGSRLLSSGMMIKHPGKPRLYAGGLHARTVANSSGMTTRDSVLGQRLDWSRWLQSTIVF